MSKNANKLLKEFTEFCKKNPDLRFWQALCVWSDQTAIYILPKGHSTDEVEVRDLRDSYYWENKNN